MTFHTFRVALQLAADSGEYAADVEPRTNAQEAWAAWFDTRSDAWRAQLNDHTEAAVKAAFVRGWHAFARFNVTGTEPANLNGVGQAIALRKALR
jgi:hypothetical protein